MLKEYNVVPWAINTLIKVFIPPPRLSPPLSCSLWYLSPKPSLIVRKTGRCEKPSVSLLSCMPWGSYLKLQSKKQMKRDTAQGGRRLEDWLREAGGSSKEPGSRKDPMVKQVWMVRGLEWYGLVNPNSKHTGSWTLMRGSRHQRGSQWWLSQKLCQSGHLAWKPHSLVHKGWRQGCVLSCQCQSDIILPLNRGFVSDCLMLPSSAL